MTTATVEGTGVEAVADRRPPWDHRPHPAYPTRIDMITCDHI